MWVFWVCSAYMACVFLGMHQVSSEMSHYQPIAVDYVLIITLADTNAAVFPCWNFSITLSLVSYVAGGIFFLLYAWGIRWTCISLSLSSLVSAFSTMFDIEEEHEWVAQYFYSTSIPQLCKNSSSVNSRTIAFSCREQAGGEVWTVVCWTITKLNRWENHWPLY